MQKFKWSGRNALCALTMALGLFMFSTVLAAQTASTGAIQGTVTDPSGAAVQTATVTATNNSTGATHVTKSLANGTYLLPLLEPGDYTVTFDKSGFQVGKETQVPVAVAQTVNVSMKLQVGSSSQTVEVTTLPPLIEPENANLTTTITPAQMDALPNPGNDISQYAMLSPGATVDVHGGGSLNNVYMNGVTGATVQYTIDGQDADDPFLDQETSGPSNMLLGQNAVSEVSVNTDAYEADQGRMAAGQVNILTKSGTNAWHGNAQYTWNGRVLNAYDFFDKNTGAPPAKPFDDVNMWMGSLGGPIKKNKLFFFFDNEGIRIDLPITDVNVKVPSPEFITYAECQNGIGSGCSKPTGVYDTSTTLETGSQYQWLPINPNNGAWLQQFFALYTKASSTAPGVYGNRSIVANNSGISGCPINNAGTPVANTGANYTSSTGSNPVPDGTGCYNLLTYTGSATTPETYTLFRMDYTLNQNNTIYWKFTNDQGTQTTGINPVNPDFDEDSFQPQRDGLVDWTHVFTPQLTNDFNTGFLWYGAIFVFDNPATEQADLGAPGQVGDVGSPFQTLGSTSFPQGRNITQYEFIDNLTWTRGAHSFKFGENFRRELVTDQDIASGEYASSTAGDYEELIAGVASASTQDFPYNPDQRMKYFSLDMYAMDTWRATHNVTVTYGLRATHNSNVYNKQPIFADWADFDSVTHPNLSAPGSVAAMEAPVNALETGTNQLWTSVPFEVWQPRLAVSWEVRPKTLIKVGFGMFSQVDAASVADTLAKAAPFDPAFTGGITPGDLGANGSSAGCVLPAPGAAYAAPSSAFCDNAWAPTAPDAAYLATHAANSTFQSNFAGGAPSCEVNVISPGAVNPLKCIQQLSVTALPAGGLLPEIVYNESVGIQHQFGNNISLNSTVVGTRSQHLTYDYDDNGYEAATYGVLATAGANAGKYVADGCQGCFWPWLSAYYTPATTGAGLTGTTPYPLLQASNNVNAPDPRFTAYTQYRYNGYSNYYGWQNSLTLRNWHNFTLQGNYTWSRCFTTGTPFQDGAGSSLAATYQPCGIDIINSINVNYTYNLPFHATGLTGKVVNGWQVSGATFFDTGTPLLSSSQSTSSVLYDTSGSKAAIPLTASEQAAAQQDVITGSSLTTAPSPGNYAVNTPLVYAGSAGTAVATATGTYQYLNPFAFGSVFDSTNTACYNPVANTEVPVGTATTSETTLASACQLYGNIGAALRGPNFNWTNFQLMKETHVTERVDLRFGVQASNLFNHPNFGNPSVTGNVFLPASATKSDPLGLNSTLLGGGGDITALSGFSNSFLGNANGGDANPRMFALTIAIKF